MFYRSSSNTRAFSLIELLITAAIIGIVTAIVVVRYGAFNNSVLLKSQAFEMALDLREAQVFAISVRGAGSEFREEYGLYFDKSEPDKYLLFQDSGTDNPPNYETNEEVGKPYFIDSRFQIVDICVNGDCATGSVDTIAITFQRPDFDALFKTTSPSLNDIASAEIILQSVGSTETRSVVISATGQITVK